MINKKMIEIDKNIFKILNIIYLSQFLVKSKLYKVKLKKNFRI